MTLNLQLQQKKQGTSTMWEDVVYLGDFSTYSSVLLLTFCNPVPHDCFYLYTALVLPVLKERKELCW